MVGSTTVGVSEAPRSSEPGGLRRWWPHLAIVALAVLLWAPRLTGPIDLRYDAGVYYTLGTSLARGGGYRILTEPGAPEGVQYPPGLPMLVAAHQLLLGSSEPAVVAPWLRVTYFLIFTGYGLAILALARRHLPLGLALAAAAFCLLHIFTIFLSDLLFSELPFALVTTGFLLVAGKEIAGRRGWQREGAAAVLAVLAFLLRTAGIAVLAAWVFDALVRRRWRLLGLRAVLAALPFLLWQAHVARVQRSGEYRHPAYEYQRAPYQYYNVPYGDNVGLRDPFQPELGGLRAVDLARRVIEQGAAMPRALGEAVTSTARFWTWFLSNTVNHSKVERVPYGLVNVVLIGAGCFVLAGLAWLAMRGEWLIVALAGASLALVCTTPWPGQFSRYLAPLAPVWMIAALYPIARVDALLWAWPKAARGWRWLAALLLLGVLTIQLYSVARTFLQRQTQPSLFLADHEADGPRFVFHDGDWLALERAIAWLTVHAPADAIVATTSPHLVHLLTGRLAVLPPMEAGRAEVLRLLDGVPASHVIIDELPFLDVARRYVLPALEGAPDRWRVVYAADGVRVFQRRTGGQMDRAND